MLLDIDSHSGGPIYRQIIEQVRRQIMTGEMAEGEQVMSVRELAGQIKVNPMTISKAYAFLETEGLLERRRGIGLFVVKIRKDVKDRTSVKMLEDVLSRAAATAVQMGIDEDEAAAVFGRLYREYDNKRKEQKLEQRAL